MRVQKTLTDAGYVVVGIGVLGVQQVQQRSRALQNRVDEMTTPLSDQADHARTVLASSKDRAQQLLQGIQGAPADVRGRVEPWVKPLIAPVLDRVPLGTPRDSAE